MFFVELAAPSVECAVPVYRLTTSKGLTFVKKWKWLIYNIFSSLCIFDGFLNFLGSFFVELASITVPVYRLTTSKCLTFAKKWKWLIYNIFAFLCIFDGFLNVWGCFCGIGIPSDLRFRPERSHHLPGALLSRWLQAVYRVSNERLHLQLYRKGAYIHYSWLYYENTAKKMCYFTKVK